MCCWLSPTRLSRSRTADSRSLLFVMPCTYRPSPTISPTLMRGLRLAYGSWKTTWMSRRAAFSSRDLQVEQRLALEVDRARTVGGRRRRMTLPSVVLPQPDSPTRPERLALLDAEADAVDRPHRAELADPQQAAADVEVLDEVGRPRAAARARTPPRAAVRWALVCPPLVCRRSSPSRRPSRPSGAGWSSTRCRVVLGSSGFHRELPRRRASASSPSASAPTAGASPAGVSQQRLKCSGLDLLVRRRRVAHRACGTGSGA